MKKLLIYISLAFVLISCSHHREAFGPTGEVIKIINCPRGLCYEDIGKMCGSAGYTILKEQKFRDLFGNHVSSEIMYKCGKSAGMRGSTSTSESNAEVYGTSFFINNSGFLITNFHVIEQCQSPSIGYKSELHEANIIATDRVLDLALLKINHKNETALSLSNKNPSKLQRVIAAGYPFGKYISDDLKFTSGVISSLKGPGDDSTRLQVDAALNPGNSGGPIVDEDSGQVLAVSVAGIRKDVAESIAFGIKSNSVIDFLDSNDIKYSSTAPTINPSRSALAEKLENSIGYITCN